MVTGERAATRTGMHQPVVARVLGGFEVTVDGRRLARSDWQRLSAERLVKLLLATPGHAISRDEAIDTLWPEADPDAGHNNLRKALHFARRALDDTQALVADGDRIALDGGIVTVDLDRLEAAFDALALERRPGPRPADADPGDPDDPGGAVETVLELGPLALLPDDRYEDWLVGPRERLRSRWQQIAIEAARRARRAGRSDRAHEIAEQLLAADPTDEAAHRLAIELYAAEGRHHAARRQFELCRRALRSELEVDPSPETEAVFRDAERTAAAADRLVPARRLIARRAELERIEPALDRVAGGRPGAVVLRGPAGIGKTRLLQEVAAYGRSAGWRILAWQAVEAGPATPYGPFALGMPPDCADAARGWPEPARSGIATVAPGLGLHPEIVFQERGALLTALVAAVERLALPVPLLVAIDDVGWLDAATTELLQAVLSGLGEAAILLAVTYRDDDPLPPGVTGLLDQLRRASAVEIALGPLAARDVPALVTEHLGGESVQPELARRWFEQSAGNPLFCLELARAAADRGTVRLEGSRWTLADPLAEPDLPETVRTLVERRSGNLSPASAELLAIAAELGPTMTFDTLAAVLPDRDEAVRTLDATLRSGLLVERGGAYAFAHPLFRVAVGRTAGAARRGRTQLAIALALAGLEPGSPAARLAERARTCADPATVAEHALAALDLRAPDAGPVAVAFGFAAGRRARQLFDREAAVSLLERSLAAWRALPSDLRLVFDASDACASLAELHAVAGDRVRADACFREATNVARTPVELADAYDRFSWLPYSTGDFEATLALMDEALGRIPEDAAAARATIHRSIGWSLGRLHRLEESVSVLEDAAAVLERSGNRMEASLALDQEGMMAQMLGRTEQALACLERSLSIALDLGDARAELARLHLGMTLTRSGQPHRARPHLVRALDLAHQMGDRYREAVCAWGMAEAEDALGNLEAARAMREREIRLLQDAGGNAHNEALAQAHLSHIARLQGDDARADAHAAAARTLAARDADRGYGARIEEALHVASWAELQTG